MTITGGRNAELKCTCDECGCWEWGGAMEFADFVKWLKEHGWKPRRAGGEPDGAWEHVCPECREDDGGGKRLPTPPRGWKPKPRAERPRPPRKGGGK
jgi:hypothetical protein